MRHSLSPDRTVNSLSDQLRDLALEGGHEIGDAAIAQHGGELGALSGQLAVSSIEQHVDVMRWPEEGGVDRLAATSTPRAVLFSALTTVASFESLAVSHHRDLASMGILLTIAISWSLGRSLLVLPHILALASAPRGGKA